MDSAVLIFGAVAVWMLSRWVTKAERARDDLRDVKGKLPALRANRFFEHGTFSATETAHCRNTIQTPVTAMLHTLREEPMDTKTADVKTIEELLTDLAGNDPAALQADHSNWLNDTWKNYNYLPGVTGNAS